MLPLNHPSFAGAAGRLRVLFSDLDDTLTWKGTLPEEAYSALWALRRAGIGTVIVTGRPAGWCDHIARMWPVEGVVGENGAFCFFLCGGALRKHRFFEPRRSAEAFARIIADIEREVPAARVATDQAYREFDLAIDHAEDAGPLSRQEILRIVAIFERHGARARVSSIHVNGWLEDFTKLSGCRRFLEERHGRTWDAMKGRILFCGDSPNDADLFHAFDVSCAVANFADFKDMTDAQPTYIASRPGGAGFAEIVEAILRARPG